MHPCSNIKVAPPTTPCTAQVAGHPSMQSDPAKLRAGSTTILAAETLKTDYVLYWLKYRVFYNPDFGSVASIYNFQNVF